MKRNFENIGLHVPEIMLPAEGTDLNAWAVVACDQYTSQPAYWEEVNRIASGKPSTLHMTLPEIYLKDGNTDARISSINKTMDEYLADGTLAKQAPGFILTDRSTERNPSRKGLVIAVDLEKYDYTNGSQTLIRATEGTVLDRIPPRVKIRENAALELPHIMMLVDDPERTVIEPLFEEKDKFEKVYDFDLMQHGGHITGWKIEDEKAIAGIADALAKLGQPDAFSSKYRSGQDKGVLLFAVGDGNHSLASAKAHWENIKKSAGLDGNADHPARYALAEVVNVHDAGIVFEPIHRVIFDVDTNSLLDEMYEAGGEILLFNKKADMERAIERVPMLLSVTSCGPSCGGGCSSCDVSPDASQAGADSQSGPAAPHIIPFIKEGKYGLLVFTNPSATLAVGSLQATIDTLLKNHPDIEVDYIHGDDVVTELGSKPGNMGFFLPPMDKNDLFRTVIREGVLPRKTFSMGEAEEKRYYMECRAIK